MKVFFNVLFTFDKKLVLYINLTSLHRPFYMHINYIFEYSEMCIFMRLEEMKHFLLVALWGHFRMTPVLYTLSSFGINVKILHLHNDRLPRSPSQDCYLLSHSEIAVFIQ